MEFHDYCCMLLPFKSNRREEIPLFLCFFYTVPLLLLTLIYVYHTLGLWGLSFLGMNIPLHIWETFVHYLFK